MTIAVGERTEFGPNVHVHRTATVGADCRIGANVWIGPGVVLGAGCVVKPGAVIGGDGFGYERDADGRWAPKPHGHGVTLGDDVHVGSCACVDRGSWRDTFVGAGSRIDNLVHVAHNVQIGLGCVVVACAELSGSVVVGDGAWIGPRACVRERRTVGRGALVGMGAVVLRDVPANQTWAGCPARCIDAERGVRDEM